MRLLVRIFYFCGRYVRQRHRRGRMAMQKQGFRLTGIPARFLRSRDQSGCAEHLFGSAQIADDRSLPGDVARRAQAMLPGIAVSARRAAALAAVHPAAGAVVDGRGTAWRAGAGAGSAAQGAGEDLRFHGVFSIRGRGRID